MYSSEKLFAMRIATWYLHLMMYTIILAGERDAYNSKWYINQRITADGTDTNYQKLGYHTVPFNAGWTLSGRYLSWASD